MCGSGIAIFEKDGSGKAIALNPNVAFEMGIMQQQGKHVEIFIPKVSNDEKSGDNHDDLNMDLFFDVRDWWKNRYDNEDELINKIKQCLPKII